MFRNTALANTPTYKLILGFGLCTLGGAMLYAYFKQRDEDEDLKQKQDDSKRKQTSSSNAKSQKNQQAQKEVKVELKIANEHVPLIAGRQGANLKSIQDRTQTTIHFRDKNDSHKICEIAGCPDNVKEARSIILKEIERSPIVKEEIYVPQSVCGKIMGRCGEAMQEICRLSLAKVSVDSGMRSTNTRRITISGNRQQVNIARKMIEDKIEEDEHLRKAVEEVEQKREPRRSPPNSLNSSMYSSQTSLSSHLPPREKLMASRHDEKPMEVYVSAIASPAKFWVQLIGPQSKKLDDLVSNMTAYYSSADNRAMHQIHEPYLGQIVATIFKHDSKWYRAEVVGILPNQYNPNEIVLDLYFVDYGDSEYVLPHEIFELRTDFLTLRFQAVECFLASVKSTIINHPDTWEPHSIEFFEEFTQVARWKKLISRVVTYKDRVKSQTGNAAAREGSPIPGVEICDVQDGVEVNLGHMMIAHRYALPSTDDYPRARSPYNTSRSNSNDALTSSTSSSIQQNLKPQSPPPISPAYSNGDANSTEDALIEEQLKHLKKSTPYQKYFNGNSIAEKISPAELMNGNGLKTATNGHHITPLDQSSTFNGNPKR
ncbi:tudor and KH domain-containing protein homolog [Stomoxys calcitrans]|uniref:Tudor domain-containing protein n=1 Tax=Stomoxys calcitrans TaxID=35570 RepID=A0A1I8P512_STOCA|nr:tudor and KH domain-containing protein homolog [Stomoxys calcitrans]XP_013103023.1 tudor and KH domain-containing protein homolog [Stomoxys calcitrans]XP_013103024.1 tudor and KH domain-containing protein homolog [Stomoxys calcitrans]XP_013103025.1 tudor and KH domain-containing protein homolog [Stomoxys calcitrans]XP_059220842.1 tudor and KH domain-containing protein homolog [Stomoxys calcitrans]XP_059220843.1 tudor and KH domain-containing protein homolog [Stomoxys calcitrans]XP_05922084